MIKFIFWNHNFDYNILIFLFSRESSPKDDPRKKKQPSVESEPQQNVYNPSRDLYQKSTNPTDQQQPIQDVYSPTQDVQDLYKPPAALLQRPPAALGDSGSGSYNPRQELFGNNPAWDANYDHSQSHPAPVRGDPRARRDPRRRD